jgi:hypothetical protein
VDVAVPEGISSFELGLWLVARLTKVYGAVVTDVTYTADGHPTYSVRLRAATSQQAAGAAPSPARTDGQPPGGPSGDIAQSGG